MDGRLQNAGARRPCGSGYPVQAGVRELVDVQPNARSSHNRRYQTGFRWAFTIPFQEALRPGCRRRIQPLPTWLKTPDIGTALVGNGTGSDPSRPLKSGYDGSSASWAAG